MTSITLLRSEFSGEVSFDDVGQGAPLILVHGVGLCRAAWHPQVSELSKTHRVIALDMPGHGGSAPLSSAAKLPDFVTWLHAVLTTLELGPVNLAGHSMGALITGGYAVTHPANLTRVALLNGVYRRTAKARAAVEARAQDIHRGLSDIETPLERWFGDTESEQIARAEVARWLAEVDQSGYATAYSAFASGDDLYADGYAKIDCPFLALTGAGDPNSTPAMARAMARTASNGKAVVIAGHRHMVNLTAPDDVNAALRAWLETPVDRKETA